MMQVSKLKAQRATLKKRSEAQGPRLNAQKAYASSEQISSGIHGQRGEKTKTAAHENYRLVIKCLAWVPHQDDTHKSRSVKNFVLILFVSLKLKSVKKS